MEASYCMCIIALRGYDDGFWREFFGAGAKKDEAQIMKELGY